VSEYLILFRARNSNGDAIWWRPGRAGYTSNIEQAGRYSQEDAESIAQIRGDDFPVPVCDIGTKLVTRSTVNVEDGHNFATLKSYCPKEPSHEQTLDPRGPEPIQEPERPQAADAAAGRDQPDAGQATEVRQRAGDD
jgi:hypothetical protein